MVIDARQAIAEGRTALGIELGSTRIKAVLTDEDHAPLAVGSHDWENRFVDRIWTYSLEAVWTGLQQCYAGLAADVQRRHDVELTSVGALGISAMMHGYLALDSDRDQSPFVTDLAGKPLAKNPLKDPRVRRAISLMINRKVIVDRLLEGSGEPAGQMVPQGLGGYDASLVAPAQDLAAAKKLLTEAGYPQGFGLTLHSSSDRFAKDGDLAQVLGQMLSRGESRSTRSWRCPTTSMRQHPPGATTALSFSASAQQRPTRRSASATFWRRSTRMPAWARSIARVTPTRNSTRR
jgi:hypothetical protein